MQSFPNSLEALALQDLTHLGKQGFAELVVIEKFAEFQYCGGIRHGFTPQVNAHKTAQAHTVVQRLFTSQVCQVELVTDEVDAQHALQPDGGTTIAGLGVERFDHLTQGSPGNDGLHRLEKLVAPRGFAVGLEALISGHGQGLLFHLHLLLGMP